MQSGRGSENNSQEALRTREPAEQGEWVLMYPVKEQVSTQGTRLYLWYPEGHGQSWSFTETFQEM